MPDGATWTPRIDRVAIRFDQSGATTDPETGYLSVWGQVSRVGLLAYGVADGAPFDGWTEFVPAETLFDEAANRTLLHAPVTLQHPPEFLTVDNTSRFQIGSLVDLRELPNEGDGVLRALHLITDSRAIQEMRDGLLELSSGYTARVEAGEGTFGGGRFDATQLERRYNHQAVVTTARAGPSNALDRVDAYKRLARLFRADGLRIQLNPVKDTGMAKRKDDNTTIAIGDKEFTVDTEVAAAFTAMQSSIDEKDEALKAKDAEGDDPPGEPPAEGDEPRDEDTQRGDKAPVTMGDLKAMLAKNKEDSVSAVVGALNKRDTQARSDAAALAEIVAIAKPMLPLSFQIDGKTANQIMHAAIVEATPKLKARADAALKATDTARMRGTFDAASIVADVKNRTPKPGERQDDDDTDDSPIAKAQARRDAKNAATRRGIPFVDGRPMALSAVIAAKSKEA